MLCNRIAVAAIILAAATTAFVLAATLSVAAGTYTIKAVSEEILVGKSVRLEIQALDPDNEPVPAKAIRVQSARLDMGPDGMAMMTAPVKPIEASRPDALAFQSDIVMAGRWALSLTLSVEGADEPVAGTVIFTAVEKESAAEGPAAPAGTKREILYYRNPMGLPDISPVPKKDSMGMDYIPVYADEVSGPDGAVRIDPVKVQRAGVRTEPAGPRKLTKRVLASGMVMPDESRLAALTPKFAGFVEELFVDKTGAEVAAGVPLARIWIESPEILRKEADLLAALRTGAPSREIAEAKANLRTFGIPQAVIDGIVAQRRAVRSITINAPIAGTVLEKPALAGMRFEAGLPLYRIADLSTIWVMADVAEADVARLYPGQEVGLSFQAFPDERIRGELDFIYPELDTETRTARARIVVPNPEGRLKVGLYARAEIETAPADEVAVAVPKAALVDDGTRRVVFVAKGQGLFEPRAVQLGWRGDDFVEVRSGVSAGEEVVTRGNFLIDAESNLQAALAAFTGADSDKAAEALP